MPDNTDRRLLTVGDVFERNVAALAPRKGGIMSPDHYISFIVNIRPVGWKETLWIGKIPNYLEAQFIADLVYYYTGRRPFHLTNVRFSFPPLEGTDTATPLISREVCREYTTSISKGGEFAAQRRQFLDSLKVLAKIQVTSPRVQRILQELREGRVPAEEAEEVDEFQDDREVVPMEIYEQSNQGAILSLISSHSQPESEDRNAEEMNAFVPGFNLSGSGYNLLSDLVPVEHFQWMDALLKDGDSEDTYESSKNDDEVLCSATKGLSENYSFDPPHHHSVYENPAHENPAYENFRVNFYAMSDAFGY